MPIHIPSSSTSQDTKKRKRDNSSFSEEEEENIITSSSSSFSTSPWKYDVFLSFYDKDTRKSFTDHLYVDLKRRGINVYRDDETLERGKYIPQELLQAIQGSQYAIVILSENYAFSKWCLRELAKIVEWEEKKKLKIIPIFYHVDPSDVRNQNGPFAKAFAAHKNDLKVDTTEIDIWKNAFRKVGNIAGEHIHPDRYESEVIRRISEKIFYNYTMLNILFYGQEKLVAINSPVEQMMKLLDMESNDVRFLGIHGMGGVGKTTLAKVIYGRVSCHFEGSGFISCVRKESSAHGLANLQQKLLSMIMGEDILVHDHFLGSIKIRSMLRSKKVFIVLDDVDEEEQLMALAGSQDWFGAGSRVIITCRDSHLLITHKVNHNHIYKVEQLQTADALQLLSLSAFDKTHPPENYIDLCMDFVRYAQGLPLALTVLGSFLLGRTIDAWKSARDQLEEASPNTKIMTVLQISFEGLQQDSQKKLFLDMACFERWQDYNIKENMYSDIDIEVLVDKSLVTKSDSGMLFMHDLLRKMGQEIVRRECPEEPGRRSRLFHQQDVLRVLKNDTGTDVIECKVLDDSLNQTKESSLNAKSLSKMKNLRWFIIRNFPNIEEWGGHSPNIEWRGDPLKYMPTSQLRILHFYGYHLKSWPSTFQPKNLTELRMSDSHFKRLWKGSMSLCNLKRIDLFGSDYLNETPDFTGAPNLEEINILDCESLCEVHPSVGVLKRLQKLKISDSHIKKVWKGLVELTFYSFKNMIETPDLMGAPNVEKIYILDCKSLCEVFDNLKELYLYDCENLIEMPDLAGTPTLEIISFQNCTSLCEVHPSIGVLKQLQELKITGSRIQQVWKGLVVLNNLRELVLSSSEKLIETPDLTGAQNLEKLIVSDCRSLCEVHPSIGVLKLLEVLNLRNCGCLRRLPDKLCSESLEYLDLSECSRLENFPDIPGDKTFFRSLRFSEPTKKELPSSFMSFFGLRSLELKDCKNISAFPSFICRFSSLESLTLNGWSRLVNFPDLSSLKCLRDFKAHRTAISQLPYVNQIPESICTFVLEGRKRMMARKSGDLAIFMNHERGSPVEYEMEGMLEVEALQFSFNRVDLSFSHRTTEQEVIMEGWSLGYGIPDWVNNKSNGSSVKIELNGNMKGMESAFFIACDPHQFDSQGFSIYSLFEERRLACVTFKFCFETDEDSLEDDYKCDFYPTFMEVCFVKPRCVFWTHTRSLHFLERLNLDKRSFIKISITAEITPFSSQTPIMELEVKECGMHLVCPDEAGLGLRSNLDSFRQFYSAWECGMRRNEDSIDDDD